MKIAIIGAGNVGSSLGRALGARGHEIVFGVRDPGKIADVVAQCGAKATATDVAAAAQAGEVVILTVPWSAVDDTLAAAGTHLEGKVVIDAGNPIAWDKGPILAPNARELSAAEQIAQKSGARVVKAFNTHGAEFNEKPRAGDTSADTYICGDDESARTTVRTLAEDIGFHVVDCGPLRNARLLENMAVLWVHLATQGELGRSFVFKALRA